MNGEQDHYSILGVPPSATGQEIRSAYRQQVRLCHPDVSTEPHAVERFRVVREAYRVLGDPTSRADYDAQLDSPKVAPQSSVVVKVRTRRYVEAGPIWDRILIAILAVMFLIATTIMVVAVWQAEDSPREFHGPLPGQ